MSLSGHFIYGGYGYNESDTDLLVMLRDMPRESQPDTTITSSAFQPEDVIRAKSLGFQLSQKGESSQRFAGEGQDPNTYLIGQATITATIKMPLTVPLCGFIDPAFIVLWHLCRVAPYGTPLAAWGTLNTQIGSSTYFSVENVADFASVVGVNWGGPTIAVTPQSFTAHVYGPDGAVYSTATVTSVNKALGRLNLSTSYTHSYPSGSTVAIRPATSDTIDYPVFTLVSLREGVIGPCLVNKITINCAAGQIVDVTVEVKALRVNRAQQPAIQANQSAILANSLSILPSRMIESDTVQLSVVTPNSGLFGLPTALGSPLLAGYQALNASGLIALPNFMLTSFSLTVDNRLKEVNALHSLTGNARVNAFPYAMYSEGRHISAKIDYRAPLEPTLVAEWLTAHSAVVGGGTGVQIGDASLSFPEVVWTPSSGEGNEGQAQTRSVSWHMFSDVYIGMPEWQYQSQP